MTKPRVVVFGYGPLPVENLPLSGLAWRSWHVVHALLAAGHEVCFVAARYGTVYPPDLPPVLIQSKDHLSYYSIADGIEPAALDPLVPGYGGACVVSVTAPAAGLADAVVGYLPHWADLYGSAPAADGTSLAFAGESDQMVVDTNREAGAFHADVFSCADEEQRRALLAVLAARGRLNTRTAGYTFAHMLPPANDRDDDESAAEASAFAARAADLLAWTSFPLHAPDWVAPANIPGPPAAPAVASSLGRRAARKLWRLSKRASAAVGLLATQERLALRLKAVRSNHQG